MEGGRMNQSDFDKLPGLLTRKLFCQITGLNKNDLGELVKSGKIAKFTAHKNGYGRYYKADAARFLGVKRDERKT